MNVASKAMGFHKRFVLLGPICAVRPNARAGVFPIQKPAAQEPAIVTTGIRDVPPADETQRFADRRVCLVPEGGNSNIERLGAVGLCPRLAELHRPPGIHILLPSLVGLARPDLLGTLPRLDGFLLIIEIAMLGCGHKRAVDQLSAHGDVAGLPQSVLKSGKQTVYRIGLGQTLAERPDRLGIGHTIRA